MIFELRIYRTRPGKREAWVKLFEEEFLPYQLVHGVVVVASFVDAEDPDRFVWIRRYDSEGERERLNAVLYGGDHFKGSIAPRAEELLDFERIEVIDLRPTPKSVIR